MNEVEPRSPTPERSSAEDPRPAPRIAPLLPAEWSASLRVLLAVTPGGTARPMNIFTTLARHPSLFWPWIAFAGKLLAGRLPARDRELAILRTAARCGCSYEGRHHRGFAIEAGLDEREVAAADRLHGFDWSERDRLVVSIVDELHDHGTLSDATWEKMRERYDEAALIEIVMLVGHYHMVAYTLNALRVEEEADGDVGAPSWPQSLLRAARRALSR